MDVQDVQDLGASLILAFAQREKGFWLEGVSSPTG